MRKIKTICVGTLSLLLLGLFVFSQVKRPYRNGSVWNVSFIKIKYGMDRAYLNYIATDWKRNQEALKKEGLLISYKVLSTEPHGTDDWNLMLMTEFKDLTSMEANESKFEVLLQQIVGNDQKQMQGAKDRLEMREIIGERLAREIILEAKR